ncbi:DUF4276 family protein [Dehalococcoidia bacterium]|nr:DUF4276 family protein [Dehalococcoidia bacterium]
MIGFVVEDNAHEKSVIELAKKMGFQTPGKSITVMNGNKLRKARKYAQIMLSQGCAKVIVLKDMDENRPGELEKRFQEVQFPPQTRLVVITREIETWFLADEEALGKYLRIRVKAFPQPEGISNPKERLNHIFQDVRGKSSGYYEAGMDPAEIAKRLCVRTIEEKCPSFRKFKEEVQN